MKSRVKPVQRIAGRGVLSLLMLVLGACASEVAPLVPTELPAVAVGSTGLPLRLGARAVTDPGERERTFVQLPKDVLPVCVHLANDANDIAVWLDAESLRLLGEESALTDAGIEAPSMAASTGLGVVAGLVPLTAPALYWFVGQQQVDSGLAGVQALRYRLETQVLEPGTQAKGCAYFRLPQPVAQLEACVTVRPLGDGAPAELCAGVNP